MFVNEPNQWIEKPLSQSQRDELDRELHDLHKELLKETERLHEIINNSDFQPKLPRIADDVRFCVQNIGRANQRLQKTARKYWAKPIEQTWQEQHSVETWCRLKGIKIDYNTILFGQAIMLLNEAVELYSLCGEPDVDADDVKKRLNTLKQYGFSMRAFLREKFDGQQTVIQIAEEAENLEIISILVNEAKAEKIST